MLHDLDEHPVVADSVDDPVEVQACLVEVAAGDRPHDRTADAAGEDEQAFAVLLQQLVVDEGLGVEGLLRFAHHDAEVPPPRLRGCEDGQVFVLLGLLDRSLRSAVIVGS